MDLSQCNVYFVKLCCNLLTELCRKRKTRDMLCSTGVHKAAEMDSQTHNWWESERDIWELMRQVQILYQQGEKKERTR